MTDRADGSTGANHKPPVAVLRSHAYELWKGARFREAAHEYQRSYEQSMQTGDYECAAWYLNGRGAALIASFAYRDAMRALVGARKLAERLHDRETGAVVSLNLASLYLQMGELRAAAVEAGKAAGALDTVPRSPYRGEALALAARLKAHQEGLDAAVPLFQSAAEVADAQGDIALKALVLNQLGFEYLNRGRLNDADRALTEAFRLRVLGHDRDIGRSYSFLGLLRIAQGDFESAEVLLDRALVAGEQRPGRVPNWADYHARGQLRLAQGRLAEAVQDFRQALVLAKQWRLEILPADSVRLSAGTGLAQLYSSFIRAAISLHEECGRPGLAREAFEAAEELRAATLRLGGSGNADWHTHMPAEYAETLAALRVARVRMRREPSGTVQSEIRGIEHRLTEMEASAGVPDRADESNSLLANINVALGPSQALISFHLDEPYSCAWTVTRHGFHFRRLAGARQLRLWIHGFAEAMRSGAPESAEMGARLYRELFPEDGGDAKSRENWLISADVPLLDLPISSLIARRRAGRPVYLVEQHSVTILPGAGLLLAKGRAQKSDAWRRGLFLGVGDPIYNTADPRQSTHEGLAGRDQLPRLAGSDEEIRACARVWDVDRAPLLLEGPAATRKGIAAALGQDPSVIHLAAHVVRSGDDPPRQVIQLSLLPGGDPDYLAAEDIAGWRLRKPAIVVLSGCASGRTEARPRSFSTFALPSDPQTLPDAGLVGLARAWLAAGAEAVVASHWSTPDDTGEFFRSFYGQLRRNGGADVSAALAHAQIEMLESNTWRSAPKHWAAYFAIGRD